MTWGHRLLAEGRRLSAALCDKINGALPFAFPLSNVFPKSEDTLNESAIIWDLFLFRSCLNGCAYQSIEFLCPPSIQTPLSPLPHTEPTVAIPTSYQMQHILVRS